MATLGVNIDHVATVRQARGGSEPDPVAAAVLAELAGADGITVHLREDRRHIQDRDLRLLRQAVQTRLNLEMACSEEILAIALEVKPEQVTLVPERRQEVTTEGGLNVPNEEARVTGIVARLRSSGICVSLFVDPGDEMIRACARTGTDAIELHTGLYARAKSERSGDAPLQALERGARLAHELGLGVNAGHGLNYWNVQPVCRLPHVEELNIGHSIISRAVLVGMERAVQEMKALMREA
ncbi:MAG: pyridoxine 5'-phosphate synthase [Planctomycetes bacterium]|nr:pyridoxine 5'-phosphate synthase [Planctomycetota bacterium]